MPGVTRNEHIFLDYEIINIEFNVTETTVKDVYDIDLEITYNTQVPAPIVIMDPLTINLHGMQKGEEKTGQITLTNYGLVKAEKVEFTFPQSDDRFDYEYFGSIPDVLDAKTRVVIPYKITAKQERPTNRISRKSNLSSPALEALRPTAKLTEPDPVEPADNSCDAYIKDYEVKHKYECPNGDEGNGSNGGKVHDISGEDCTDNQWQNNDPEENPEENPPENAPDPMTEKCMDNCETGCCKPEANKSGASSSGQTRTSGAMPSKGNYKASKAFGFFN